MSLEQPKTSKPRDRSRILKPNHWCEDCKRSFTSYGRLVAHRRSKLHEALMHDSAELKHWCEACKRSFSTAGRLQQHLGSEGHQEGLRRQAKRDSDSVTRDAVRILTHCKPCKRSFTSPKRLELHMRSATHRRGVEVAKRNEEREAGKLLKLKEMLIEELKRPITIEMPDWLTLLHAAYPLRNVTAIAEAASRYVTVEGIDVLVWSSITRVLQLISDKVGVEPNLVAVKLQLGQMYLGRVEGV